MEIAYIIVNRLEAEEFDNLRMCVLAVWDLGDNINLCRCGMDDSHKWHLIKRLENSDFLCDDLGTEWLCKKTTLKMGVEINQKDKRWVNPNQADGLVGLRNKWETGYREVLMLHEGRT